MSLKVAFAGLGFDTELRYRCQFFSAATGDKYVHQVSILRLCSGSLRLICV